MINKKNIIAGCFAVILFALIFAFPSSYVEAASLYFSPSSVSKTSGQTFSSVVRVNTEGQAINAAQGSIVFDPAKVEVVSISKSGSIFNLWTQDPVFSNSEGTITFEGGVPNPGYSGSSGLVLTVSFRVKSGGQISASLVSGAILANDGLGTNILNALGKLSISSGPETTPAPASNDPKVATPTSSQEENLSPKVESSTHPDTTKWYNNNSPAFSWSVPSNVSGVSYLITDKATSNPGPKSDGVVTKADFSGIADGTQYFNIKFKVGNSWGTITHYQFNIDTVAPAAFEVQSIMADGVQPQIIFATTDALSGVDHYEVRLGTEGSWVNVSVDDAGKPYKLSFDRIGTQTVFVKAIDKAGNSVVESIEVTATGSAVGSTVGTWIAKLFNGLVNGLSNYGLLLALLAAIVGVLILIYELLGTNIDKLWHRLDNRRVIRKTERKVDNTFDHIIKDMQEEIKFLETISKHRPLGPEEKYLKSKIQEYMKGLKKGGR